LNSCGRPNEKTGLGERERTPGSWKKKTFPFCRARDKGSLKMRTLKKDRRGKEGYIESKGETNSSWEGREGKSYRLSL